LPRDFWRRRPPVTALSVNPLRRAGLTMELPAKHFVLPVTGD
jgi:hypothetical protein